MKIIKEEEVNGFREVFYEISPGHNSFGKYKIVQPKKKPKKELA